MTFRIEVVNSGAVPATEVVVTDILPKELRYETSTPAAENTPRSERRRSRSAWLTATPTPLWSGRRGLRVAPFLDGLDDRSPCDVLPVRGRYPFTHLVHRLCTDVVGEVIPVLPEVSVHVTSNAM